MKLFTQVPLTFKLFLSGIVPVIALFYFFSIIYEQRQIQIANTEVLSTQLELSTQINTLLETLRQERRASLNTKSEDLRNERDKVDAAIIDLEKIAGREMLNNYKNFTFLTRLPDWRRQVDNQELNAMQIVNNYQMLLDRLQSYSYTQTSNQLISQNISSSLHINSIFTNLINYISLMRLQVYFNEIDSVTFKRQLLSSFPINYKLYKSYEQELLQAKDESLINEYLAISREGDLKLTLDYLDTIFTKGSAPNIYQAEEWWQVSASGMDELLSLDKELLESIRNQVSVTHEQETRKKNLLVLFLLITAILIVLFKIIILKTIGDQLSVLRRAAQKMAQGITGINLPRFPRDEMGSLARSFIQIDRNNKKIAFAATQIGKNIFDTPFELRGNYDELGTAILEMRDSLQTLSINNENEIWIQTGLSTINNVLMSDKSLNQLCSSVLSKMISYLNADIGTLYLMN
ncbi:MAG TPA: nitrate- and nitrite sensing domain-containing protein, partial [Sphingobacteriaceae bacterium]|nr:nitrate- and nitrite sensing domain-containing protein [Sphingobacteriaceae bacterium]